MGKSLAKKGKTSGCNAAGDNAPESLRIPYDRQLLGERLAQEARNSQYLLAGAVSLVTFLVYIFCLRNELLSWDDDEYITNNTIIRSFNLGLVKSAFFEFHAANWHPLTWISHALDYAVWGLNPLGHHLTNNILHALNTFIVVVLVMRLVEVCRERMITKGSIRFLDGRLVLITGGVTGLLFGLHPVHVESVAWIAERKDLLCGLFFLLSIMMYMGYLGSEAAQKNVSAWLLSKNYLVALGFFVLALLSKPMAVSLPAVLMILDWYPFRRIKSIKTFGIAFFEKLPFIALSIISSILTILAQKAAGATLLTEKVPLSLRTLVAAKSLMSYLLKMAFPLNLMPLYPYPRNIVPLSFEYLSAIAIIIGTQIACVIIMKKHKLWFSVWSYYVVTLLPVLGLVQVGGQAMADRYSYLPSLGPFLIVGLAVTWILANVNKLRKRQSLIINLLCAGILFSMFTTMSYLTIKQMGIWRDDIDLWTYVIEKAPTSATYAYYKRGTAYGAIGQFDKALTDYDKIIALEPYHADVYYNRGLLFAKMGQFVKAIEEYDQAITWNQYGASSNVGRGLYFLYRGFAYLALGQTRPAISDFKKACDLGSELGCSTLKSMGSFAADTTR